ncbi:MAG: hypothetical protein AB7Q97_12605 [Gammaproteobacteria bacterium]
MPERRGPSLREFTRAVDACIDALDAEALRRVLRVHARSVAPAGRLGFLDELRRQAAAVRPATPAPIDHDLPADIDSLVAEVRDAFDAWEPDPGSLRADPDPARGPAEAFLEPLRRALARIDVAFERGDFAAARPCYERLLHLLDLSNDYGLTLPPADLAGAALPRTLARWMRAIYATEPDATRTAAIIEALGRASAWNAPAPVRLADVLDAAAEPVPAREAFLDRLIVVLEHRPGADADRWLRESVYQRHGHAGLEALAHRLGTQRPGLYVELLDALAREGTPDASIRTARAALQAVPQGLPIRAAICDRFAAAAQLAHDPASLREARTEAFAVDPQVRRLLDLRDLEPHPDARRQTMRTCVHTLQGLRARAGAIPATDTAAPLPPPPALLAHALLLAGDWAAALELAAGEDSLGWSYRESCQPRVLAATLWRICGAGFAALPARVSRFADAYLFPSRRWIDWAEFAIGHEQVEDQGEDAALRERLRAAYEASVCESPPAPDGLAHWCMETVRRRIDAVVNAQHRISYRSAARALAACVDALDACDLRTDAARLLASIRARHPRRSILAEVEAIAAARGDRA